MGEFDQYAELRRLIEELRLQIHEREEPEEKRDPMQDSMGAAVLMHALQAAVAPLTAAIDRATAATQRDAARDAEVGQRLQSLDESIRALIACIEKPRTRTGVMELPSGPVKMTVTEH